MRLIKAITRWIALGAILGPCALAHAASGSAFAEITDVKFQLIDLDLSDNVTPALQWNGELFRSNALSWDPYLIDERFTAGTTSVSWAGSSASGLTSQTALAAHVAIAPDAPESSSWINASSSNSYGGVFVLTPRTGLMITATASIGLDQDLPSLHGWSYLDLTASLYGVGFTQSGSSFSADVNGERYGTLNAFIYTGDVARDGRVDLHADAHIARDPTISPVPEPETYALLLAGAGLILAMRRARGVHRGHGGAAMRLPA